MASSARIEELRNKFEENPRRYFAPLANEYRKAGDIEQAIAICREYLPQQPGHMSGHIVYGQALYEARQVEEAKTVFETALSLDPENLIALRHLGDIALMVGDLSVARVWYGRVLEADPRNEEIQAQLAAIEQSTAPTPAASPTVAEEQAAPPAVEPARPTPSSAQTVVVSAMPRPQSAPTPVLGVPVQPATVEIPVDVDTSKVPTVEVKVGLPPSAPAPASANDTTLAFEPTSYAPPPEPTPAPTLQLDVPAPAASEPAPIDSFSLDGLETTSLTEPEPEASVPPSAPDIPFIAPDAPPAPPAEVASAPTVELELATRPEELPPPADGPSSAPVQDAELPMLDLTESPTSPMEGAAVPEAPPVVEEASSPVIDWSPTPEPQSEEIPTPPAPDSGPFVTETMAELYLHQGHRDEALRVYRALLDQRPGDASLVAKIAALTAPAPPPVEMPTDLPMIEAGPTIREFLSAIAMRRPAARAESDGNGAAVSTEVPREPAQPATPAAPPAPATPEPRGEVRSALPDLLGALFGSAPIAAADESAATALALAFMDLNGLEQITGAPARHASNDLSLDSVFKTEQQPAANPSSFSFDQFFSQRATAEHATLTRASAADAPESRDDVAQFTQWLEGLKQK